MTPRSLKSHPQVSAKTRTFGPPSPDSAADVLYCIGSRTGILVRGTPVTKRDVPFDQERPGLHHFCFRARQREDVDAVHRFLVDELGARVIHAPAEQPGFAPGYYSVLFEDPDGIRVEVNHVPGKGHLGPGGRLGPGGPGPAETYGADGLAGRPRDRG